MAEVAHLVARQLTPLIVNRVKLLSGVREEVVYIRNELQRMNAFLTENDAIEESNEQLQVWIKLVRGIAYDTEDVLDEFTLQLAHRHVAGFRVFLRKTARSVKNVKVRWQISSAIQSINRRVSEAAAGHERYRNWTRPSSSSTPVTNTLYNRDRGDAIHKEEDDLVDIIDRKRDLINFLDNGGLPLKVVSVVGPGGLGKTTLVRRVYEDLRKEKRFSSHVWLTVSKSPKIEDLLKDMIEQLYNEIQAVPQGLETMKTADQLKGSINKFLRNKQYLVVFDDVWELDTWKQVKNALPDKSNGSRVMLTTRLQEGTGGNHHQYALTSLSKEGSWSFFCEKVFGQGNHCPVNLRKICRSILERCDGLPLAIEAIIGVLAVEENITSNKLERLNSNLLVESKGNYEVNHMKRVLSLSYSDLPYHLKICFLYLSIFPQRHQIERMTLIRLWTAEGFVDEEIDKSKEEVAEEYLLDLINRSLIHVTEKTRDGRVKTCRIHDIWREVITLKSREHNIVAVAGNNCPDEVRRLAFHNTLVDVQQSMRFSKLRSLLMFGVTDSISKSSMPMLFSGKLRLVKVIELRGTSLETLPDEVFKLFHLRYLGLRGTKVKNIPNLISNLENLETLDLKHTYVTELPVGILNLGALRHLLVYRRDIAEGGYQTIHGIRVPTKIGSSLSSLQQLRYIDASYDQVDGTTVKELGNLSQLRKLGIVKLRSRDGTTLCSSLGKLTNLRSLGISSITGEKIDGIQSLSSPPPFLRGLHLSGPLDNLPDWISSLNDLVKLYLVQSELTNDPVQSLGDLPNLVHIELHRAYQGEELCFRGGGFRKLNTLRLSELNKLKRVTVEKGTMGRLEKLCVNNCEAVEEVPSGIEDLKNLKFFEFGGVSHEVVNSLDRHKGKDYPKISHIPFIWIEVPRSRLR